MSAPQHSNYGISPEKIQALIRAARVERAQAVQRVLRSLFHWRRKDDARLDCKAPALSFNPNR